MRAEVVACLKSFESTAVYYSYEQATDHWLSGSPNEDHVTRERCGPGSHMQRFVCDNRKQVMPCGVTAYTRLALQYPLVSDVSFKGTLPVVS